MRKHAPGVRAVVATTAALALAIITLPAFSTSLSAVLDGTPGLSALATLPAGAATYPPLSCTAPTIYNVQSGGAFYSVNTSTSATTAAQPSTLGPGGGGADINVLAVSADGGTVYTANFTPTGSSTTTIYVENLAAGTSTAYSGMPATNVAEVLAGGVNPVNGDYYYGGWNSATAGTVFTVFAFNPTTHTASEVGTLARPETASFVSGDLAFDGSGNLYVLAGKSVSGGYQADLVVVPGPIPTSGTGALAGSILAKITSTSSQVYDGIAFAANSELYAGSESGNFAEINPNNGNVTTLTSLGGSNWADMASCTYNGSLAVQKNVVGRVASGDQFTMTITGGGVSSGNVGTTTGSSTGVQTGIGEVAGPIVGIPNTTYNVNETAAVGSGANLANYQTTWSCLNGSSPFSSGTGASFSVAFPAPTGNSGAAVVCTFKNTPASISVTKTPTPTTVTAAGQTVNYAFAVTNTGPLPLTSVSLGDVQAPPASVLTSGPSCTSLANPSGTCSGTTVPTLVAGQTANFTASYTVTQADVDNGAVNDTATATGLAPSGAPVTATATAKVTATQTPGISVTKTPSPASVTAAGQTVTYTFGIKNTGNVTLTKVGVSDAQTAPSLGSGLGPISCTSGTNNAITLAPQATDSCSATYTVSQADIDNGTIKDVVTATGTPPTGPAVTATAPATVTTSQSPAITIQKTANPTTVTAAGQTVTYTFAIKNTGNVTLTGVVVSDTQTAPSLGSGLGPITCTTGTNGSISLAPQATDSCSASYTVTQADMDNGTIKDTGKVVGTPPSGPSVSATSPATVTASQSPTISIVKTANPTTVTAAGQAVTYTFAIKNTGNVTLTGVVVSDTQTAPSLDASLGPITCTTGTNGSITLAPGATDSCSATYTVTQADINNGTINDTGKVVGTPPTGPPVSATSPATVNATASPTISIVKTANPTTVTAAGQTVTYTFAIKNTGNVTLTGVVVSDNQTAPSLGSGLGPITCTTGTNGSITLDPQATDSCSATYTVTQADINNGTINDTGKVVGTPPSGPSVSATSPATVTASQSPALSIVKTADPTTVTAVGQTVTYTFAIENTGNVTLTGIAVSDTQTAPSLDASLGPITCTTGTNGSITLAPQATDSCSATYTVTQADMDNGTIKDTGKVTGDPPSGPSVSATSPATVDATATPAISIVKTADPTTVTAVGQTVTYTFAIENTGNVTLTDVGVSDAQTSPSLDASLGPITCTTGTNGSITLAAGATDSCSATYTVTQADIDNGSISDVGTASGTPPNSDTPVTGTSPATVTATPSPAISIVKTADPTTVTAVGQTVTYTFAIENTGNATLSDVAVSDAQTAPSLDASLGPITCTTGTNGSITLAPGATDSCSATYAVTQADMDNGSISDVGTASGTPPNSDTPVTSTSPATVTATQSPAISVLKTANVTTVSAVGQTVTYSFTVTNTGNVALANVDVTDAQGSPSLDSSLGPITCITGTNGSITLAPGATDTCSATYTVTQADLTNGSLKDTATASGTPPNSRTPVTGTSSLTLPVTSVSVVKSASPAGGVVAGSTTPIVYTLTVKNNGSAATTDPIVVTDAAPTGTTLVSGSAACATGGPPTCTVALSGSTISWTIPAGVAPGASYTLTFSVTANAADATGTITNTGTWSGPSCGTSATTTATCPTNTTSTPVTAVPSTSPATTPTTPTTTVTTKPPTTSPTTSPSTAPAIAFTGALLSQEWMIGVFAVLLGAGMIGVARRRRRPPPKHAAK